MATRRSDPRSRLLALAKHRAKRDGIRFSITVEDLDYPTHCPVLGLRLRRGKGIACDASPTVDRINPRKGYVPGNVLVVSMRANRLKGNGTLHDLMRITAFLQQITA